MDTVRDSGCGGGTRLASGSGRGRPGGGGMAGPTSLVSPIGEEDRMEERLCDEAGEGVSVSEEHAESRMAQLWTFRCVSSRRMHCASTVSSKVAAIAVQRWGVQFRNV
mmetsp:Transcript_14658/g.34826  ORF Transcript_14658/g.34826 Transcript_14658/m.34826 type:complete len:108 (-) Transcript_14658:7-330(-)